MPLDESIESPHRCSCLCGEVQLQISAIELPYVYCHCSNCRKSSGSAFGANVSVPVDALQVVQGQELLSCFESSPGKFRYFCSRCGSPMYNRVAQQPERVRVRLGSFDTPYEGLLAAHIFVGEKAPWYGIQDARPQHEGWPDRRTTVIPGSRQPGSQPIDANHQAEPDRPLDG